MIFSEILDTCLLKGGTAIRKSEPHIEYDLDAAEGLRFWSMNSETDDLLVHAFTAEQLCATDWESLPRNDYIKQLETNLIASNNVLRSMSTIVSRKGDVTDWGRFANSLSQVLEDQHAITNAIRSKLPVVDQS